ncbi:MAG: protein kinase [Labilithrix sp.]|nr:protein kinase [Labilithrix sp.]
MTGELHVLSNEKRRTLILPPIGALATSTDVEVPAVHWREPCARDRGRRSPSAGNDATGQAARSPFHVISGGRRAHDGGEHESWNPLYNDAICRGARGASRVSARARSGMGSDGECASSAIMTTLATESPEPPEPPCAERSSPVRLPVAGDRVASRFTLTRVLGSGGMGVVFEAHDDVEGETVALKWLRKPAFAESLRREFRAVARLRHPNLTRYFDLFLDADSIFVTMERIEGAPLDLALRGLARREAARADAERVEDVFRQLASALGYLHAEGVVHCDLKPTNVLIEPSGRVRIVDFGLAQHREATPHRWLGTRGYAAPEVAAERRYGPASDWYAFGKMLSSALAACPALAGRERRPSLEALASGLLDPDPSARLGHRDVATVLGERPSEARSDEAGFVGRSSELVELRRGYEACLAGGVRWVDVRGASGVGKTRLVSEACAALASLEEPPWTCWSTSYEREFVPFRALASFLVGLSSRALDELVILPPEHATTLDLLFSRRIEGARAARDSHALASALALLVARLAARRPIVLVLDQLHVGDRDSAELLVDALERCPRARVLVIAICRSDAVGESEFLAATGAGAPSLGRRTLEVAPMAREEILELVARCAPVARGAIADHAGGLPWLALELAREDAAPLGAAALIERRLARLPEGARRLVEMVAVAGHPLPTATARVALGARAPGADDVRQLTREGILRESVGRGLVVDHDLVASATLGALGAAEARAVHASLAETIQVTTPEDHAAIAVHFFASGRAREAVPHALEAADRASSALAFGAEASWIRRVLDSGELGSTAALDARRRLARALGRAGRGGEAAVEYERAAKAASGREARLDRCRAAESLFKAGHERGFAALEQLTAEAGLPFPKSTAGATARLAWERARLALRGVRLERGAAGGEGADVLFRSDVAAVAREGYLPSDFLRGALYATIGLRLALDSGRSDRICRALCDEVMLAANLGVDASARIDALLAQARALAESVAEPELGSRVRLAANATRLMMGDFGGAAVGLGEVAAELREGPLASSWELTLCRLLWIMALQFHGSPSDPRTDLGEWIADARARRDLTAMRFFINKLPLFHLMADDVQAARASWDEGASLAGDDGRLEATALMQRVYVAQYDRESTRELTRLRPALRRCLRTALRRTQGLRATTLVVLGGIEVELARRGAGPLAARLRALAYVRRLRGERTEYAEAFASSLMAALRHQIGDDAGARVALSRARAAARTCGMRFIGAAADLRYGQLMDGRAGGLRVTRAIEELSSLGAVRPARFARAVLPGFADPAEAIEAIGGKGD